VDGMPSDAHGAGGICRIFGETLRSARADPAVRMRRGSNNYRHGPPAGRLASRSMPHHLPTDYFVLTVVSPARSPSEVAVILTRPALPCSPRTIKSARPLNALR